MIVRYVVTFDESKMPNGLSLRNCLLVAALLIFIFQVFPIEICTSGNYDLNVERQKTVLVEKDVFAVYLRYKIENLSVRCQPLHRGGMFDLSISTKYVDPYLGEVSAVWVQPGERGIYNLTINFMSNESWEYVLGVYTRNFNFYEEYYGKRIHIRGFYIELQPPLTRHPGNWTINVLLEAYSLSPSLSYITLPTPVNTALLVASWGLIAYINSFILIDTYFKSKKEIIPNTRWIMVGLVLLISVYAAYQIYNFTVSIIPGES